MAGMMDQAPPAGVSSTHRRLDPILTTQEASPAMSVPHTPDSAASPPGPITYATTRHRCPHCRRSYAANGTAVRHVERCWQNPDRRTCLTCVHRTTGAWGEPSCAIDEGAWPCCSECGNSRRDENNEMWCRHAVQPANYLQVLCPSWEAKS